MTSGRLTPAAAILTRISPVPGAGTGRSSGTRTSGAPGARIAIAVMREGRAAIKCPRKISNRRGGIDACGRCDNRQRPAGPGGACRRPRVMPIDGATEASMDDDTLPKKKPTHELGQDLALLSVAALAERVALLKA